MLTLCGARQWNIFNLVMSCHRSTCIFAAYVVFFFIFFFPSLFVHVWVSGVGFRLYIASFRLYIALPQKDMINVTVSLSPKWGETLGVMGTGSNYSHFLAGG